jgi:23S rRNA (cytidine1920-2'-O)/16S rRNA (cytidine1409-2'-O)-methyltransferase
MATKRLDELVAASAGVTRSRARALIIAGRVRVDGYLACKPGAGTKPEALLEIERPRPYVSRGGEKLEGVLRDFALDVGGMRGLDVGASTGGFTDCLLAHGAEHVVALDVGYGQLDYALRINARVTVMERCNFRLLADDAFGPEFDIVTIDASFISVVTMIARAKSFLKIGAPPRNGGFFLALIKPQFEAGKHRLGSGGVVRELAMHRAILREARDAIAALGLIPCALALASPRGPAGNREFFMHITQGGQVLDDAAIDTILEKAHAV